LGEKRRGRNEKLVCVCVCVYVCVCVSVISGGEDSGGEEEREAGSVIRGRAEQEPQTHVCSYGPVWAGVCVFFLRFFFCN